MPEKADILISEPMGKLIIELALQQNQQKIFLFSCLEFVGFLFFICILIGTLLVNERMLESYVIARDRFLTPNGKMFPTLGR